MPKRLYVQRKFSAGSMDLIDKTNTIIEEYEEQGYNLTLRQVYYQHVSRGWIENKQSEYKRLGSIISDGRRAGLIDWNAIVDRTRYLRGKSRWNSPGEILRTAAEGYHIDLWVGQKVRVEVWFEKDALAGIFEGVCNELDVPCFSCRGYASDSEVWAAAQRLRGYSLKGQCPIILHFGDHDPSGIDMTRDITDRLSLFGVNIKLLPQLTVNRLALNMDQIQEYQPPPNPAKETDSRFAGYLQEYGNESWELDALEPQVLEQLVRSNVEDLVEPDAWQEREDRLEREKALLSRVSSRWDQVQDFLQGLPDDDEQGDDED